MWALPTEVSRFIRQVPVGLMSTRASQPPILHTRRECALIPLEYRHSWQCISAYSFALRSLSALVITETDEKLIAAAAMIGDSNRPNTGYSTPAAIGTPAEL